MSRSQIMSDTIHDTILYSGLEHEIISTPIFNRLHRISQSSLVFLTFPSNKVKRFEHSVGTMYLAGEILYNSVCNVIEPSTLDSFIKEIKKQIKEWRKNFPIGQLSLELKNVNINSVIEGDSYPKGAFFNKYCPTNLDKKDLYSFFVLFQSIRIAGLLHDVGHLPYSHILEKALRDLYEEVNILEKINKEVKEEFLSILNPFLGENIEIHEEFGRLLIDKIEESIYQNMSVSQKSSWEFFFFKLSFYFAKKILGAHYADNNFFGDLHLIISGVVDADRLDYCSRDSFSAALDKNVFPYRRFLMDYYLIKKTVDDTNEHFLFCPAAKNLKLVELLLRKRFDIFSDINYHHRVHKHEIILEKVITQIGLEELLQMKPEDVKDILPDTLPLEISSIWKLIREVKDNQTWLEYQLLQLDDGWLDTLLKHKFFAKYSSNYLSVKKHASDILWNQFDELISTTKRYHSLIKRSFDFDEIDKVFYSIFFKKFTGEKRKALPKELSAIEPTRKYSDFRKEYHSFFFNLCVKHILVLDGDKTLFYQMLEETINKSRGLSKNYNICNCIIRSARFKLGYNTVSSPVVLVDKKGDASLVQELSTQKSTFDDQEALSEPFHFYYLPSYDAENMKIKNVDTKLLITKILAPSMEKCLESFVFPGKK